MDECWFRKYNLWRVLSGESDFCGCCLQGINLGFLSGGGGGELDFFFFFFFLGGGGGGGGVHGFCCFFLGGGGGGGLGGSWVWGRELPPAPPLTLLARFCCSSVSGLVPLGMKRNEKCPHYWGGLIPGVNYEAY